MADFKLKISSQKQIAYTFNQGRKNLCLVYLHGWSASRNRRKGFKIAEVADREGCSYLSLDYTGHGESTGTLVDFTVGNGIEDTMAVIRAVVPDVPLIVIGNSMGGWIGLWLTKHLKQVASFVGLAPAPDIMDYVWEKFLPDEAKTEVLKGHILGPSPETKGFCFTKELFQDAKNYTLLNDEIVFNGPVRLFLGDQDEYLNMDRMYKIKDRLTTPDVVINYIKGANHHLADDGTLTLLDRTLTTLIGDLTCRK